MIKSSYQLCTVFGIPIKLDFSLIVLLFLLITNYGDPVYGIAAGIALLLSITLHELGHSLVAMAFGCRVRDITLMMLGGCATLLSMPRKAWQEFLVAAAGPAVSALLAFLGLWLPHHLPALKGTPAAFVYYQIGWLNLGLFTFNLLPAFPMDGGRILRSFLQQFFMTRVRATWVASRIGRFVAILLGLSVLYSLFTHTVEGYMLIRVLIAFYIYQSAEREYRMVLMEEGAARRNPFAGFPFFGGPTTSTPPPDDGKAVVSPPPYARGGATRVDVRKEE
ncbi:MAG TPA: site-2 protease family protein [Kiritimatiellia bacterium]|nr:site-2 protease family protein [Kiritimatiellia bacterium]HPS08863.1 site-2 protease family protein [Kiritimatiellia bacterium]